MIRTYLSNVVISSLLKNSYLSETQVDTLLCRKFAEKNGEKIKNYDRGPPLSSPPH